MSSYQRTYEVHGVGLSVSADDRGVLEAMDLRLRGFTGQLATSPELRLEFRVVTTGAPKTRPRASRPVYDTPHGSLHYSPDDDILFGEFGGVHLRCEPVGGVARMSSAAFAGRALYLATHPLATISLMEMLERRGLFSLHAACLATDRGRGVLVAGPSGAGKSTLALALARAGMSFLSDDVVFLRCEDDPPIVRAAGFADAVGLTAHALECFGELHGGIDERPLDGFPKPLARIEDLFGPSVVRACEPKALVFPAVAPGLQSRLTPLDSGEALLRLVPDVLLTEPTATKAHIGAVAALLGQVRCYALSSGVDLERAAERVRELVQC